MFRAASFWDTYFLGAIGARMMMETALFAMGALFLRNDGNSTGDEAQD